MTRHMGERAAMPQALAAAKVPTTGENPAARTTALSRLAQLALGVLIACACVIAAPTPAKADTLDQHKVATVSPSGTTINLFDYYVHGGFDVNDYWDTSKINEGQNAGGNYWQNNQLNGFLNEGINKGHQLKFSRTYGAQQDKSGIYATPGINWGLGAATTTASLQKTLQNSFPALDPTSSRVDSKSDVSLAYLFDDSQQEGKKRYSNVQGLLQLTDDGYYQYSSADYDKNGLSIPGNFAEFEESTNSFNVYDSWAVYATNATESGQFFPFNSASEVFQNDGNGSYKVSNNKLTPAIVSSRGLSSKEHFGDGKLVANMNHYFGLSMSTRFMQPEKGVTERGQNMTYFFSGDDDALVYIDDVLVGDLSGIKDAASIKIDFATGQITIKSESTNGGSGTTTTLKQCFLNAGRGESGFIGNTFKDNTVHTLKFFYLERGNMDSNLALKYNLVDVPESAVIKIDQVGNAIAGAGFTLYAADGSYNYTENDEIASGVTDWDGSFVLKQKNDGTIITFDQLASEGKKNFVLRETEAPTGYRKTGDLKLKYVPGTKDEEFGGHLLADDNSHWTTGAWAASGVQVTAPNTIYKDNGGNQGEELASANSDDPAGDAYGGGTIFAVLLYYGGNGSDISSGTNWHTVHGDSVKGWDISDDPASMSSIVEVAKSGYAYEFKIAQGTGGAYRANIDELPGYLETYYNYIMSVGDGIWQNTKFTVGYYYTEAGSLSEADAGNTYRLWVNGDSSTNQFRRQFSIQMYVPNIQNYLLVQKTDENFDPINDGEGNENLSATFNLYSANQLNDATNPYNADGSLNLKAGEADKPFDQAKTGEANSNVDALNRLYLDSTAAFPSGKSQRVLPNGTYYLVEQTAPTGYKKSSQVTKVVVNDDGVYADAGKKDDDVRVRDGIGVLVQTMRQFASGSDQDVDLTLRDVIATQQTLGSALDPNDVSDDDWSGGLGEGDTQQLKLSYANSKDEATNYRPSDKDADTTLDTMTTVNDEGWSRLQVRQNYEDDTLGIASNRKDDLRNVDIDKLFSGVTIVQVRNQLQGSIVIEKQMQQGETAIDANDSFTMQVTLQDAYGKPVDGTFGAKWVGADGNELAKQDVAFTNGVATVQLQVGQKVVIGTNAQGERLDPTYQYKVEETNLPEGYVNPTIAYADGAEEAGDGFYKVASSHDPFQNGAYAATEVKLVTVTNGRTTLGLTILKQDADGGAKLKGAQFVIYEDDGDDDISYKDGFTKATLYTDSDKKTEASWPLATGDNGELTVWGLQHGKTYWLVETATPAGGYQLLQPFAFTVGNDGSLTFPDGRDDKQSEKVDDTLRKVTFTVTNHKVPTLPKTGGPGNWPLWGAGMALIAGATYLVSQAALRRRGSVK